MFLSKTFKLIINDDCYNTTEILSISPNLNDINTTVIVKVYSAENSWRFNPFVLIS